MHSGMQDEFRNISTEQKKNTRNCNTTTRKRRRNVKRDTSAFLIWSRVKRHEVTLTHPDLSEDEISMMQRVLWKLVPDEDKIPFVDEAKRLNEQHIPDKKTRDQRRSSRKQKLKAEDVKHEIPVIIFSLVDTEPSLNKPLPTNPYLGSYDGEYCTNDVPKPISPDGMNFPSYSPTIFTSDSKCHDYLELTSIFDKTQCSEPYQHYKILQSSKQNVNCPFINRQSDSVRSNSYRSTIVEHFSSEPQQIESFAANEHNHMLHPASISNTDEHNITTYNSCRFEKSKVDMSAYETEMHYCSSPCGSQTAYPLTPESLVEDTALVQPITIEPSMNNLQNDDLSDLSTPKFMECPCIECIRTLPIIIIA